MTVDPALELSLTLATAAHGRDDPELAAQDVLAELCAGEPVTAAALTCHDPITETHRTLSATGYPAQVLDYLRSPAFLVEDVGYRLLRTDPGRRARCWRDTSVDYPTTRSVRTVFGPAGYAGGATARLTTRAGHYTGDLHVSTTDAALPTATLLAALHHAAPLLAAAVDVTRRPRLALPPAAQAAIVTDAGGVAPLADHPTPDAALVGRVTAWLAGASGSSDGRFRYYLADGECRRIRLVRVDRGTLLVSEPDDGHPLTARELEVLTQLTGGLVNAAIARRLGISERTVAHHVEHILDKLGTTSRTSAASRAVQDGLRLLPS